MGEAYMASFCIIFEISCESLFQQTHSGLDLAHGLYSMSTTGLEKAFAVYIT